MKNINHFINSVAEMMEAQRIAKSPPRKTTRINCEKKEQIVRKMLDEHYEERLKKAQELRDYVFWKQKLALMDLEGILKLYQEMIDKRDACRQAQDLKSTERLTLQMDCISEEISKREINRQPAASR